MAVSKIKRKLKQADGTTITVGEAIVRALQAGAFLKDAAQAAGVTETTVHNWLARGRLQLNENGERLKDIANADLPFLEFFESVEKSRAEAVIFNLAIIRQAASKGHWQAAAWYLERTRPDEYGRRTRFDVGGKDGEGMTVAELLVSAMDGPDTADGDPDLS